MSNQQPESFKAELNKREHMTLEDEIHEVVKTFPKIAGSPETYLVQETKIATLVRSKLKEAGEEIKVFKQQVVENYLSERIKYFVSCNDVDKVIARLCREEGNGTA